MRSSRAGAGVVAALVTLAGAFAPAAWGEGVRDGERGRRGEALGDAAAALGGLNGADRAVLVGVATRSQRAAVIAGATRAAGLVDEAEGVLRERGRVIEALIPARPADAATLREELARVRRDELAARVPLLRGRALALLAAAEAGPTRAGRIEAALAALRQSEPATTAGEGLRRVTLAHVLALAGGPAERLEAIELLDATIELPVGTDPGEHVPAALVVEAVLARWMLDEQGTGESLARVLSAAALAEGRGERGAGPLVAEALARRGLARMRSAGNADGASLDACVEPLAGLGLESADAGTRQGAAERIDGALAEWPERAWPARGRFAAGLAAAVRGETARALELLDGVPADAGKWAGEAAWLAANLRIAGGGAAARAAGVEGLVRALDDAAWTGRARAALEAAAAGWAGAGGAADRAARGLALRGLLAHAGDDGDRAARRAALMAWLLEPPAGGAAVPLAALREAVELDGAGAGGDAGVAASAMVRARLAEALLLAAGDVTAAPAERLAAARLAAAWGERSKVRAAEARRALGEALFEANDPAAAAELAELDAAGALDAAGRLLLARAQVVAGDRAAAVRTLQGLTADLERGAGARPALYWEAWATLLELLAEERTPGRAGEVRLRVRQLELIDPALGGGAAAGRLRRLGAAAGP